MARTDGNRHTVLVRYIEDLIQTGRDGRAGAERAFVERHARDLGGYTSYLLNLHDVVLGESFQDALRALDGEWPLSFTGYRLAFPARLTATMDESLDEARAQWRAARTLKPRSDVVEPRKPAVVLPLTPRSRRISA